MARIPLDPPLKHLAEMAASVAVGCSWCIDFGYWTATSQGFRHRREIPAGADRVRAVR